MRLIRLLLKLRRKRDPLVFVLTQERDYLRGQVSELQARINALQAHVLDANDRLLVREGAYRKAEPTAPLIMDPLAHEADVEWEARREREEIEEHVQRAQVDPMYRSMIEEAAEFDPRWAMVAEKLQ
jgi:hypothetical protein